MKFVTQVYLILTVTVLVITEKNEDEGRPYEFGFTIDGQQHRHEKKDDKGIIQGEFGFITADGIYHVTVYATDENGNFKILSTKNLRVSAPLDGSPLTGPISPEAGKYLKNVPQQAQTPQPQQPVAQPEPLSIPERPVGPPQQQAVQPVQPITTEASKINYPFTTQPTIKPACAGCGYVTTAKSVPGQPFPFQNPIFKKQDAQPNGQNGINQQGGGAIQPGGYQQSGGPIQSSGGYQPGGGQIQSSGGYQQGESPTQSGGYQNNQQSGQFGNEQPAAGGQFGGGADNFGGQQGSPGAGYNPQTPGNNLLPPGIDQKNGQVSSYQSTKSQSSITTSKEQTVQGQLGPGQPGPGQQGFVQGLGQQGLGQGLGQQGQGQQGFGQQAQGQQYPSGEPNPNPLGINAPEGSQQGYQQNQGGGYPQTQQQYGGSGKLQNEDKYSTFPPVSIDNNVINVGGKNPQQIPIQDKFPGMQDGLPEGIEEKDIKDILYKFHYTVGFHGHYEKGLKNGAKIGGYFVNGRDGISRIVTYVADENGYRAKTKFINLGLDSEETPKEGTEKKFGLKSFEFVWYPIE